MKRCSICKLPKPKSSFHRDKSRKDGLMHRCKICESVRQRKYKTSRRASKRKTAEHIRRVKSKPCADCGKQYPYWVMEFDHVKGEKLFNVSRGWNNYGLDTVKQEIAKCEVVCANCHKDRTYKRQALGCS